MVRKTRLNRPKPGVIHRFLCYLIRAHRIRVLPVFGWLRKRGSTKLLQPSAQEPALILAASSSPLYILDGYTAEPTYRLTNLKQENQRHHRSIALSCGHGGADRREDTLFSLYVWFSSSSLGWTFNEFIDSPN